MKIRVFSRLIFVFVQSRRWVEDLESVVEAADPQAPFALLGISQGAAVCLAYSVKYPERAVRRA